MSIVHQAGCLANLRSSSGGVATRSRSRTLRGPSGRRITQPWRSNGVHTGQVQQRSAQPHSCRARLGTSSAAGSASHPRPGLGEQSHHQRASPGRRRGFGSPSYTLHQLCRSHQDLDAFLFHWGLVISSSAHPDQSVYSVGLEILHIKAFCFTFLTIESTWNERAQRRGNDASVPYLYKLPQLCICGIVCDEESQTVISNLHWCWSVHFRTQRELFAH